MTKKVLRPKAEQHAKIFRNRQFVRYNSVLYWIYLLRNRYIIFRNRLFFVTKKPLQGFAKAFTAILNTFYSVSKWRIIWQEPAALHGFVRANTFDRF